ncbi:MAG: hypothetical protein HN962_02975, partial [Actinobacteria bacterium]|nr:hypothetical protein [Actinomycetota bacterium]
MSNYLLHARKLIYVIIFGALVWFISFTIFPENQIIKISVGDISPVSFTAPNYIEVIDEEQTAINKALAVESVNPIYSIDTTINDAVINGVKDMFLAVIEARILETLIVNDSDIVTENTEPEVEIKNLTKLEQIEKITESLLFSTISTATIEVLVEISNYDLNNKSNYLAQLELEAKSQANDILNNGINNENLNGLRQSIVSNPPYLDLTSDLFLLIPENRLRSSVSEIIAENLVSNQKLEEDLWNNQKQQISDSVEPVVIKFFENDLIIQEGTIVNQIQYNTLDSFGYLSGESRTIQTAALPIIFSIFLL